MPATIRPGVPGDEAIITEFNYRLAEETEGKVLDRRVLEQGVRALLADAGRGRYFLAEDEGKVVGQIMITFEWSDWRNGWIWWIQSVYVPAEFRRRGVFRALFQHVAELAQSDKEVVGLRLYMEKDNRVAQDTYVSLGMETTGYIVLEKCPL